MSSNEEIVLSDICEAIVDCEHKTAPSQIGGIPLIRTTDIENGKLKLTQAKKISESTYKEWSKRLEPKAEDIILAREAPVGEVGYIPKKQRVCLGQRTVLIRINPKLAYPRYILYLLCSKEVRQKMASLATGSVVSHLNMEDIRVLPLGRLPILEQQRIIGDFLGALDDKIEVNQQMNRTLEAVGQAVFRRWFVDFEFPNQEGKPYKSSGGEMVSNEELEKTIPKGWQVGEINDLSSSITNGGTPKRMESNYWNGNIPWFKTGELTDGQLIDSEEHITEEGLRNSSARLWDKNTILIALYASPTVGRLGLLKTKAASNQACSGLVAKKEIGYGFLFYTLFFKRTEFNNIAVGACQQNISQQIVKESQTIIPPTALLKSFNDITNPFFDKQSAIVVQNRTLAEIRDELLPKLMSGKVRVPLDNKLERQ
jgi:type I restriction enzyme S subunit